MLWLTALSCPSIRTPYKQHSSPKSGIDSVAICTRHRPHRTVRVYLDVVVPGVPSKFVHVF
jgi:hypothetical protein